MKKKFSSLTDVIYRVLSYPYPYRVALMRLLMQKAPSYRPHYLACMFDAARLASALGHKAVSVIEFGVAGGNGLLALERYAALVEEKTGVRFQTYGFDMGNSTGLPPSSDPRDLLYLWQPGDYKMDEPALRKRLSKSQLYLGNVADTIEQFPGSNPPPVAMCVFDLDYYSSTAAALKLFDIKGLETLPRVTCYFDDADVSSNFNGVLGAIADFNTAHGDKKIFRMEGHYHHQTFGMLYNRVMHMHDFLHPQYNRYIAGITATELPIAAQIRGETS